MLIPESIFKAEVDPRVSGFLDYPGNTLYGMPHWMAHYGGAGIDTHRLAEGATCLVCGRRATNAHHAPAGRLSFVLHAPRLEAPVVLRPALFALCGSGNQGCHGHMHQLSPRYFACWEWDSQADADLWWSGELLNRGYRPHSPRLFLHGCVCIWESGGEDHIARFRGGN